MDAPSQEALLVFLDEVHGYDFIAEILQVRQVATRVEIDYRGIYGEYNTLPMPDTTIGDLMGALL